MATPYLSVQELEHKVTSLMLELEEVKIHASDEAAQMSLLRDELRKKEAVS